MWSAAHTPAARAQTGALALGLAAPNVANGNGANGNGAAPDPAALATRLNDDVAARLQAGRDLLTAGDPRSEPTLRAAAQGALQLLKTSTGTDILDAAPGSLPDDALTRALVTQAVQAHLWWGIASQKFGSRDETITALSRAKRLLSAAPETSRVSSAPGTLERDINLELGKELTAGLPLIAPDDVLSDIAQLMHGDRWTPREFGFAPAPGQNTDLLVTDGELFPPPLPNVKGISPRTPALYQTLTAEQLPTSLKLNKMVAGYARETDGPNKGQWRQVVRVFYASNFLTQGKRNDLPRARRLAEEFLKVQALFKSQMGLTNLYTSGDRDAGVTTLWLLEVSALWPNDDDDPRVQAQLGPLMPVVNIGPNKGAKAPETTPLMRPWTPIAGHAEGAPGEILFWKAGLERPEAEWLRELFHEYGHVAVPPFGGFAPPSEPYANGVIGETLGMMWAAGAPESFAPSGAAPTGATAKTVATASDAALEQRADYREHVRVYALPARALFVSAGPNSVLRNASNAEGLRYLNGATTYLERVYGAPLLGRALQPLALRAQQTDNIAARRSLLRTSSLFESVEQTWSSPWNPDKTLPLWLPGALDVELDAATLVNRGAYTLRAGTRAPLLLWVPPGTAELRIEGAGAGSLSAMGTPFSAKGDLARIFFSGNGWQKLVLVAGKDATIGAARLIRK